MGKKGSVLFDDTNYYEQHKDRVIDLAQFKKSPSYDYDTQTFTIHLNDSQPLALTFRKNQDGKISGQAVLFEVGYELWRDDLTDFELKTVLERCSKKLKKYRVLSPSTTSQWFKNTRVNLRRTIEGSKVKGLVKAFDTENPRTGRYQFSIRRLQ